MVCVRGDGVCIMMCPLSLYTMSLRTHIQTKSIAGSLCTVTRYTRSYRPSVRGARTLLEKQGGPSNK